METLVKRYKVRVTFTEPLLGSQPQRDIAQEHVMAEAIRAGIDVEDELGTLPEELEKGTTAFHKDEEGNPVLWDYQVKGFLKEWGRQLNGFKEVKALRDKIGNFVYVFPRRIPLQLSGPIDFLTRPIQCDTARGPRIAIARSEMAPAGTTMEYEIRSLKGVISEAVLTEILDMGVFKGHGQWRGGSYGRFTYEITEVQ
jgi:hypothetical protein